jgi:hypothetical protein
MALDQSAADALLKLRNATLYRGLIDAQHLGRCLHATCAGEGQ